MNIPAPNIRYIPTEIIVDGKLVIKNLLETGQTQQWLDQQLKQSGVSSICAVLYAELQSDGSLYIKKKN